MFSVFILYFITVFHIYLRNIAKLCFHFQILLKENYSFIYAKSNFSSLLKIHELPGVYSQLADLFDLNMENSTF